MNMVFKTGDKSTQHMNDENLQYGIGDLPGSRLVARKFSQGIWFHLDLADLLVKLGDQGRVALPPSVLVSV